MLLYLIEIIHTQNDQQTSFCFQTCTLFTFTCGHVSRPISSTPSSCHAVVETCPVYLLPCHDHACVWLYAMDELF